MTEVKKLVERLKAILPQMIGTLPVCPFDRRSPDYWTTANDKPCHVCGGTEEVDKCRGADLRCMDDASDAMREAAALLQSLDRRVAELEGATAWRTIDSAPRDAHILAFKLSWGPVEAHWEWGDDEDYESWVATHFDQDFAPTHWMPLPDPPGPCEGRGREGGEA